MKTTILPTTTTKNRTEPKFKSARGVTGRLLNWASMNRPPWRHGFVLIALILACFALSPQARATCQEGCLTNENTVLGDDALLSNTGFSNTAIGFNALTSNTLGFQNTATGDEALASNTAGDRNTATGELALASNTIGGNNTANGCFALSNNNGIDNTATGFDALSRNTTGGLNTATGSEALSANTTGSNNTAYGWSALESLSTGSFNIAVGFEAGLFITGNNNIDIGNKGQAGENFTIRIGKKGTQTATFIAGISGATVPTGVAVIIDATGHLGTTTSSARFKEGIQPMDKASEAILALKPVTFRYKHNLDPHGIPQFGLVAEEVEKVNPDLVARDADGKAYTVRYEAVNAMLLNEFLKEHHKVEKLEATVSQQRKDFEAAVAELKGQIQKVSARVELSKSGTRTVQNNR